MNNQIVIVEDDADLREALCDTLALAGYTTLSCADGASALGVIAEQNVSLVISDVQMGRINGHQLLRAIKDKTPNLPVLLMTAYGSIQSAVQAMREGAVDYLVKPFDSEVLVHKVAQLLPAVGPATDGVVLVSASIRETFALAKRVAQSDATVLITGESGTGKEVMFRYIHQHSRRTAGPAVAINCAAIPENMLEAVLFGYEKGAFTGAYKASPGKFEQAQGGSLLLDEISEMDLALQAKLLRVLQEREVERLGGSQTIKLDVRVIATSNRPMAEAVAAGRFREDLYYRLNVFPINMPSLRDRREDIVALAEFLLTRAAQANGGVVPALADDARARLQGHSWPGNVRELDNVMQRALILQEHGLITASELKLEEQTLWGQAEESLARSPQNLGEDLKSREQRLIVEALEEGHGSRSYAAGKLGISPRTLRYKIARMKQHGIAVPAS